MAAFTSLGVGSGLDLNTIVTQLVALERRPLQQMQSRATELGSQVSLFGKISSLFSSLQDASNKLTDTTLWQKSTAASADASAVSVSAGSGAAIGSYAVTVTSLAANQTVAIDTPLAAATDSVGSGKLTLQLGTWSATTPPFIPRSGSSAVEIDVGGTDTLSTLRDKINASGAGVTASLVTDANGVRLSVRSDASGLENGFRLSVVDDDASAADGNGLSRFAYDPPNVTGGLTSKQAAANAVASINGIEIESASNAITGAIDGITVNLIKQSATPVGISVTRDRDAIVTGVKAFAEAYNALASYLGEQTKYDPASKSGGPLQGDGTATALQSQLRAVLNTGSGASETFKRLSDIGLQAQRNGTLVVNETKLQSAANNLTELKKAFSNNDSDTANHGFARRYATLASQVLGTDGPVNSRTTSLQKLISKNSVEQTKLNDRVDQFQKRMVAQYTALDANVARFTSLSNYVTQQIAQMNKSPN